MNLVIGSSVTLFSKSCWGVMSLWGATCSLHPVKQAPTSSVFKEAKVKSTSVWRCSRWFLHVSSVESPRSHHMWECACVGESGAVAPCADNEKKTSDQNAAKSEWHHNMRQGCGAHTCTLTNVSMEWVQWHLTLVIQLPVNTMYSNRFVHDCAIICFPLSDLNVVMSRHFFLSAAALLILCTSCQKFAFSGS